MYLVEQFCRKKAIENVGFPIIEEWMVATEPPKEIIQWDRRRNVVELSCVRTLAKHQLSQMYHIRDTIISGKYEK